MNFEVTENFPIRLPSQEEVELIRKSNIFSSQWYADQYPDVRASGLDPEAHYLLIGAILLRDPSPNFSTAFYLADNPDVAAVGMNPLLHFIKFGASEGRSIYPSSSGRNERQKILSVGPSPWIAELRSGAFLESILKHGKHAVQQLTDHQRELAMKSIGTSPARISVIMPSWNREAVIKRALSSAFDQSFPPAEVILVDDGSEDSTLDTVRANFADQISDGQLHIIEADHGGVSAARNHGLAAATGDLIAYLDSDNCWRPDYLLTMAAIFSECDTISTAYCALAMNDVQHKVHDLRGRPWNRRRLIGNNFIDLNVFMHRRAIFGQYGGFDTKLNRLVDWDLIVRYTRLYEPVYVPYVGVDYYLDQNSLNNITRRVPLDKNKNAVLKKNRSERLRRGLDKLHLAYVLWDWPALSQTFVINEIRWLVNNGYDVKVYYHTEPDRSTTLNFAIDAYQVDDHVRLAELMAEHKRNQIHAHFAYPCTTALAWPAAQLAEIPFTFFAHAVDIFHESNIQRNRINEVVSDPLCQRLFVHGDYHRGFLEPLGVPTSKIAYNFQAVDIDEFGLNSPLPVSRRETPLRGLFVGRFVEKKGIAVLLQAAEKLGPTEVQFEIYGYGPDEGKLREKVDQLGIRNINFHKPLDGRDEVIDAMRKSDFLCVPSIVAKNGDTEGFPTVILEAMSLGIPVITSDVSSVPDFLQDGISAIITRSGDSNSLADGVRRLARMSSAHLNSMLHKARAFLRERIGTNLTMRTYLDTWLEASIEIILVTYDTDHYRNIDDTREVIRRIREHTTTPYTLSVIDNGSDPDFLSMLREYAAQMPQMRLIELKENRYCGGATNIALAASDAVYAVYICSKEGFIQRHGWERPLIKAMRENHDADMGGYFCHMPKFANGTELQHHPAFDKFRNPGFAIANPDRPIRHIQGGVYILRRDVVSRDNGFSALLPQSNTDVEFSYFLESENYNLCSLDAISSLTVKTRPTLSAIIDENTTIAHPLTHESAREISQRMGIRGASHCNICDAWEKINDRGLCGSCGSDGIMRKIYQRLAHDWRGFRNSPAMMIGDNGILSRALAKPMFDIQDDASSHHNGNFMLIASVRDLSLKEVRDYAGLLARDGLLIWPGENEAQIVSIGDDPDLGYTSTDRCSRLLRSDWRVLHEITRIRAPQVLT
ncbi:glycosyltransferase [Sphingobium herbicidovorans]